MHALIYTLWIMRNQSVLFSYQHGENCLCWQKVGWKQVNRIIITLATSVMSFQSLTSYILCSITIQNTILQHTTSLFATCVHYYMNDVARLCNPRLLVWTTEVMWLMTGTDECSTHTLAIASEMRLWTSPTTSKAPVIVNWTTKRVVGQTGGGGTSYP